MSEQLKGQMNRQAPATTQGYASRQVPGPLRSPRLRCAGFWATILGYTLLSIAARDRFAHYVFFPVEGQDGPVRAQKKTSHTHKTIAVTPGGTQRVVHSSDMEKKKQEEREANNPENTVTNPQEYGHKHKNLITELSGNKPIGPGPPPVAGLSEVRCTQKTQIVRARDLQEKPINHPPYTNRKKVYLPKNQIPGVTQVATALFRPGTSFPAHAHSDMSEVFIVLRGQGEFRISYPEEKSPKNKTVTVEAGSMMLMPPKVWHEGRSTGAPGSGHEDLEMLVLGFAPVAKDGTPQPALDLITGKQSSPDDGFGGFKHRNLFKSNDERFSELPGGALYNRDANGNPEESPSDRLIQRVAWPGRDATTVIAQAPMKPNAKVLKRTFLKKDEISLVQDIEYSNHGRKLSTHVDESEHHPDNRPSALRNLGTGEGSSLLMVTEAVLPPGEGLPTHIHDDAYEVYFVLDGKGRFELGGGHTSRPNRADHLPDERGTTPSLPKAVEHPLPDAAAALVEQGHDSYSKNGRLASAASDGEAGPTAAEVLSVHDSSALGLSSASQNGDGDLQKGVRQVTGKGSDWSVPFDVEPGTLVFVPPGVRHGPVAAGAKGQSKDDENGLGGGMRLLYFMMVVGKELQSWCLNTSAQRALHERDLRSECLAHKGTWRPGHHDEGGNCQLPSSHLADHEQPSLLHLLGAR